MIRYHLSDNMRYPDLPFNIQYGRLKTPFSLHVHDFGELVVILDGSGIHEIDGTAYHVQAGDIYMMLGDTGHGFSQVQDLKHCNIMLPRDFSESEPNSGFWPMDRSLRSMAGFQALFVLEPYYRREHRFTNRLHVSPQHLLEIDTLLRDMVSEYEHGAAGYRTMLQSGLNRLFVFLSRLMAQPDVAQTGNLMQLSQTLAYLQSHFTEPLTLPDLAAHAFLSVRHFSRVFHDNFQQAPMEYVRTLRLEHACSLLRRTSLSVSEIAHASGYGDSNLFSRLFSNRYQMTPRDFRKRFGRKTEESVPAATPEKKERRVT